MADSWALEVLSVGKSDGLPCILLGFRHTEPAELPGQTRNSRSEDDGLRGGYNFTRDEKSDSRRVQPMQL